MSTAIKVLNHIIKNTKLLREQMLEMADELGMTKTEIRKIKIRDISAELEELVSTLQPEEKDDEHEDHQEAEDCESGGDDWQWFCHRKYYPMDKCCDKCYRWYCKCDDEDEAIKEHSDKVCQKCGMANPNNTMVFSVEENKETEDQQMEDEEHEKSVEEDSEDEDQDENTKTPDDEDEDEDEPEADEYYIGDIPENCTMKKLAKIMAKALIKLRAETKVSDKVENGDILDLWFEHDSNGDDNFDHLVPEDQFDEFVEMVEKYISERQ